MITENIYISYFNIYENGTINVKKTTEIVKDKVVIASSVESFLLEKNDERADEILGVDTKYRQLAQKAWDTAPVEEEVVEEPAVEEPNGKG